MMALCCIKLTEISKDGKVTYSSEELKTIDIMNYLVDSDVATCPLLLLGGDRWKEADIY